MQFQHKVHEEPIDLQSAFDRFDLADKEYSEAPTPETFERRRSAMDLVSDMLLRGEGNRAKSPILNHLANIVEINSQNR